MRYLPAFGFLFLFGCASPMSSVQVHHQSSNLLDDCERLGSVQSQVANYGTLLSLSYDHSQSAISALQVEAERMGADSVAVVNVQEGLTHTVASGVAYRCFGG